MPSTSQHVIRQQHLHVDLNGTESDALALQRRLPGICRDWLIPAVEQALEQFAPPDGHLYIDRLEVDAGMMEIDHLEYVLAEKIRQPLEKTLREYVRIADLPTPIRSDSLVNQKGTTYKTEQQATHDAFIYFLIFGSLPWTFRLSLGTTLEQVVTNLWQETAVPGAGHVSFANRVAHTLALETSRQRLTRQFTTGFLEKLLASLSPAGKKEMDTVLERIRVTGASQAVVKQLEQPLWETAFKNLASGNAFSSQELLNEVRRTLPVTIEQGAALDRVLEKYNPTLTGHGQSRQGKKVKVIQTKDVETVRSGKAVTGHEAVTGPQIPLIDMAAPSGAREGDHKDSDGFDGIKNTVMVKPTRSVLEEMRISRIEHPEAREGIYIENAGLVILHPFLPRFFEALNIATEDKLLQPERALCLLHFLTTGRSLAPEYELVLPKILCNVPLETPVASDLALTMEEKEEASALLLAVIRHWEVLRNTSPDGLRGTFLVRPGKLSLRDNGDWLLQVESNSFDILLEQLPWGISMIKLPWMGKMLLVEWCQVF